MKIKIRLTIHSDGDDPKRFRRLKRRINRMSGAEIAAAILAVAERPEPPEQPRAIGFRP